MGSPRRSPERSLTVLDEPASVRRFRQLRLRKRPLLIGELLIVAALMVVYDRLRSWAPVDVTVAVDHGLAILRLEMSLHLRVEDGLNTWLAGQPVLRYLAADYYQFMHETVALSVLAICYLRRPAVYRSARNALVLTNVVGLVLYALYPVAPPRLLPDAGFVDLVARAGFGASHGAITADQYGAMPSLHLAWATWATLTVFAMTRRWWLRALLCAHVAMTAFIVVATGNHYVFDVVVGMTLGVTSALVTGLLVRRAAPSPLVEPA
jgi:membrane-associated phospholipid phosphatase